jgi:hypothetical protein
MISIKWIGINWLFVFIVTLSASVTTSLAQIPEPQPIAQSVPDNWRGPFAQFLRDLGMSNVGSIMAQTKFGTIGGVHRPDSVLFRIEDKGACAEDVCLTIIGHPSGDRFVADAMFAAGGRGAWGDHTVELLGLQALPHFFESRNGTTTVLFETSAGWIVRQSTR